VTPQRHGGETIAASGFRADGEGYEGGGGAAPGPALSRRSLLRGARVHGLAAEPDVVEGEAPRESFADEDGSASLRRAVTVASAVGMRVTEGLGAVGGGDVGGVEEVLCSPGDSVRGPR